MKWGVLGEEFTILLENLNLKECIIKKRKNGNQYFTNNYGYLLLGTALMKINIIK